MARPPAKLIRDIIMAGNGCIYNHLLPNQYKSLFGWEISHEPLCARHRFRQITNMVTECPISGFYTFKVDRPRRLSMAIVHNINHRVSLCPCSLPHGIIGQPFNVFHRYGFFPIQRRKSLINIQRLLAFFDDRPQQDRHPTALPWLHRCHPAAPKIHGKAGGSS